MSDALSVEEKTLVETYVSNNAKSPVVAYILWFCLSFFGAHRFYMGKPLSAVVMFIFNVIMFILGLFTASITWWLIGLWALIDAFLLYGWLKADKEKIRNQKTQELLAQKANGNNVATQA